LKQEHRILFIVACFYIIYIGLFLLKFDFNPSATVELSESTIQRFNGPLPENLIVQRDSPGRDGQFYYMMSTDLNAGRIDIEHFRYQRILYPAAAYVLSFGLIKHLPSMFLLINFFSILISTYFLLLILKKYGANLNLAFLWAFNVGFLGCILSNLISPLLYLFVVMAVYFYECKKYFLSSAAFGFAVLTKELALIIVFPFLCFLLMEREHKKALIYCIPLFVLFVWQAILIVKFGSSSLIESLFVLFSVTIGIAFENIAQINFLGSLREIYPHISGLPVVAMAIIIAGKVLKANIKKPSLWMLILIFHLLYVFLFSFANLSVGDLGRFAVGLFLFTILFCAERKEGIGMVPVLLMTLMSLLYFLERIVFFKVDNFVS